MCVPLTWRWKHSLGSRARGIYIARGDNEVVMDCESMSNIRWTQFRKRKSYITEQITPIRCSHATLLTLQACFSWRYSNSWPSWGSFFRKFFGLTFCTVILYTLRVIIIITREYVIVILIIWRNEQQKIYVFLFLLQTYTWIFLSLLPFFFRFLCHYTAFFYLGFQFSLSLRAGRSGDRILVEVRFSAPIHTGPGTYPASDTMGNGFICRE